MRKIALRRPELSDEDVGTAWESFRFAAVRVPGEVEMRIGYDLKGRCIELPEAPDEEILDLVLR